jgi:hypothetical protein
MLIDAIVKLHDKIQNMKLGANRDKEITELEDARLRRLPLLPQHLPAQFPGHQATPQEVRQEAAERTGAQQ